MAQLSILQTMVSNALEVVEFKLSMEFLFNNRNHPETDNKTFPFLVREPEDANDDSLVFHPTYAHQVFGENESIFGYRDLRVRIYYTAGSLSMYLGVKYGARVDDIECEGLKADDVTGQVSELLTTGCYYTNIDEFLGKLKKEDEFRPIGEMIDHMEVESDDAGQPKRMFEFYKCDVTTPGFLAFHARLQTFILWFVDAGSYIDSDDPQWSFYIW